MRATASSSRFWNADDEWLPNKLATQLDRFARDPTLDAVFGHAEQVMDSAYALGTSSTRPKALRHEILPAEDIEMRMRLYFLGGLSYVSLPRHALRAIEHDDELRTRYYARRELAATNSANLD